MLRKTLLTLAAVIATLTIGGALPVAAATGYQLDNVSDTTPQPGETFTAYANGFASGSDVQATLLVGAVEAPPTTEAVEVPPETTAGRGLTSSLRQADDDDDDDAADADEGVDLGMLTADAMGVVQGDVTIPEDTELGEHTLQITGTDADGAVKVVNFLLDVGGEDVDDDLPNTGLRIGLSIAVAVLAFSVGGVLLTSARRRDSAV